MTEQTIGTARLDLVVTTDKLDAAVESAKRSVSSMSAAAQAEYNKLNAAEKRRVDSYLKQANSINLTRQEQILFNAALKGTPTHILDELKNKLATSGASAQGLTKAFSGTNKSARELQFAMRGLPAQVTDIFTSLASGQRPMMVLLQQGGQLKDMFGGVVPAARALGGAILGLVNPITIAAVAAGGLFLAWKQGSDESLAFRRSLALTGDAAGVTAGQLSAMAAEIDASSSATQAQAANALASVAATGKFTGDQLRQVAEAAIALEQATGRSIQQTVAEFASLKDDPLDAILKLNGALGDGTNVIRFLTPEQLKLIETLKEQGRTADAAAVAIKAYSDAIAQRTPQVVENLGAIETVWKIIKQTAKEAWDEMLGIGRDQSMAQQISGLQEQIARAQARGFDTTQLEANLKGLQSRPNFSNVKGSFSGDAAAVDSTEAKEAIAFKDRYLTREEEKKKAIAQLDRLRAFYTEEEYKTLKKGIEERFKPPKGPKGQAGAIENAQSKAALQAFEDQLKKEQGLLANQKQLLEANYAARNVLAAEYYAEQKRLATENTAAQERALEGEIAALKSRSLKGKDSINNARELAEKEALLAKVRADGATALEVLNIQEAAQLKQRQQANIAYADALDSGREALKAELDSQVLRISVGEREFEIRSRIIQLYRDEAKELLNLARQRDAGEIDPETYKARVEQLKAATADEVQIVKDGYDQMAKAQANWANGALKAFADYRDAANDVAGQTYSIFNDALSGLEDVFVDFFTKGKADWKGFFDDIGAEITRFVVRQQLNKLIKKFIPGMGEEGGDNASALSGAAGQLAASAAPLYGAAAALSASAAALAAAGTGQAAAGGSSGGGGWFGALLSMFGGSGSSSGSSFSSAFANGGAFAGGVQYFARGDVFDRPTAFGMRSGIGVMGEAGPEAVMPLKRGSDGKLGVAVTSEPRRVTRGGDTYIQVQGAPNKQTLKQLERANGRGARREMARTGG